MKAKSYSLDESLGFSVYRTHTLGANALRRAFQGAGYDVTPEQWGVLARLREEEGTNQTQLGEKTLKDRHNITRILNLLEKRGYVERRPDETDKRVYRVYLTKAGRATLEELAPMVLSHRKSTFKGLTQEDLRTMRTLLEQVVKNLEKRLK
jgi:MarR family transcriptional regulator, organic hydroperoxide resistance regulator